MGSSGPKRGTPWSDARRAAYKRRRRPYTPKPKPYPVFEHGTRILDGESATQIRDEHALGKSINMLGKEFGCANSIIVDVIERWIYGDVR